MTSDFWVWPDDAPTNLLTPARWKCQPGNGDDKAQGSNQLHQPLHPREVATIRIGQLFDLPNWPDTPPRYNIAPSQDVPAVIQNRETGSREFRPLRWGLVPSWAKDPAIGNRMINARSETAATKPAFRKPLRDRRCLILADGFYEWKREGSRKQPYYIKLQDGKPFAFAGLWDHWALADGEPLETCTILTTMPNAVLQSIHDRMPVILPPDAYTVWLDPTVRDVESVQALLTPYPVDAMTAYPVSTRVNNPRMMPLT